MGWRPRVLQLGKFYAPVHGGMETYVQQLSEGLRAGVEVEVVVANLTAQTERTVVNGVPVTRLGARARLRSQPLLPGVWAALRGARADVVHLHAPHPLMELALLTSSLRRRSRLVVTWHSDVVRQQWLGALHRPIARRLAAEADAICIPTPAHIGASQILPAVAGKCTVCPFGVDLPIAEPAAVTAVRAQYGPLPLVTAVGRLVDYKGFDVLIDAMVGVPATALIIGAGPKRAALARQIEQRGLSGRVHLLGEQPDLSRFLAASQLFVLPSRGRNEMCGIVQLEAMAQRVAVISTRLGTGVEWVNRDGETGVIVSPDDPLALRAAITALLADDDRRRALGRAGRARVEREFTVPQATTAVLRVYERVLGVELVAREGLAARVA